MGIKKRPDSCYSVRMNFYLPVVFIDYLTILNNLLLAREHRIIKLDSVIFIVERELPNEKFLGAI